MAGWVGRPLFGLSHSALLGMALATELEAVVERVEPVSQLLTRLPGPVLVVLRYLFAFLNQ